MDEQNDIQQQTPDQEEDLILKSIERRRRRFVPSWECTSYPIPVLRLGWIIRVTALAIHRPDDGGCPAYCLLILG